MITDRIGRQEVLLPINHDHFNYRKKQIHLEQISPVEILKLKKDSQRLHVATGMAQFSLHLKELEVV